jgi:hypothetical protein
LSDSLYDDDALIWAEQQAGLLRRLADGERGNHAIDWPHVIEEIAGVGLSQLHACESLLRQALVHLLKLHLGEDRPAAHWRAETAGFLADAQTRFTPSMRQRIDLKEPFVLALRQVRAGEDATRPSRALPAACPFVLDDLLSQDLAVPRLVARLKAAKDLAAF